MSRKLFLHVVLSSLFVISLIVSSVEISFDVQPVGAEEAYVVKTGGEASSTAIPPQRKLVETSDGHLHVAYHRKDGSGILQIYHAETRIHVEHHPRRTRSNNSSKRERLARPS